MTLWHKRWHVTPPAPQTLFDRFPTLHPLVVQILYNRGLTDSKAVDAFLAGKYAADNPFLMQDLREAVTLIRQLITQGEHIVVYGDYDVDGVTASAILVQTLRALGAHVEPYIPDRIEEGYGLNTDAIRELSERGFGLLLTVDCGIRSLEEVALAQQLGMAVVVTDHHHVGQALPQAEAVINPRRSDCTYPFKDLAGAGVAYKLAQGLLRVNQKVPLPGAEELQLLEENLLDLVALGTVADMVPLLEENHVLVQRGVEVVNAALRPGLAALMEVAGVTPGKVTASTISYVLAPRLNAAGRIGEPLSALELLMAADLGNALPLAHDLEALNQERRALTQTVQDRARQLVLEQAPDQPADVPWPVDNPPLLFAASPDFPAGIVGLAAGRLSDEFYRPAVVVEVGETFSKGSARSIPEFHITAALDQLADLLVQHGGHAAAAGFTVRTANLDTLRLRLLHMAHEQLADVTLKPSLSIDAEIPLSMVSWELYKTLHQLAPFGYGNPQPLLVSRAVHVLHARAVGNDGRHLKLYVAGEDGRSWNAIAFRQGYWIGRLPKTIDLAYQLQRNEWNGRVSLQLNVQDIHPTGQA